jgi:magnesium transporter
MLHNFADPEERPRIENVEHNSILIYRYPIHKQTGVKTSSIAILISTKQNYIIVIQKEVDHLIDAIKDLEEDAQKKIFEHGINYVLYKLLDNISNHFFNELEKVENETDKIEKKILRNTNKSYIKDILDLKRTLTFFHKAIIANRDVVKSIENGKLLNVDKKILPYIREIYHDLTQLNDLEETRKEILTGTLDIHMSAVSNNLNIVMKRLTVMAALIWIPTLIAAIYGMNFGQPLTGASQFNMPELSWAYGYPFALGLMVISVLSMYLWFKKQKWI